MFTTRQVPVEITLLILIYTGDVYKKFIHRLSETFRQRLAILGYIPGSFDAEEARSMLGDYIRI